MLNEAYLNQFYNRYTQREQFVKRISYGLISVALVVAAMLGAVTFASLFHVSILLTGVVFVAGLIVDAQINFEKLPKLMHLIFVRHLFMGLEVEDVTHQLLHEGELTHDDIKAYLDKWVALRREFYRANPGASAQAFNEALFNHQLDIDTLSSEENKKFIQFVRKCEAKLLLNRLDPRKNRNLLFKKILAILGIPLSMTAGLGLGAIAYSSFFALLGLLGVSTVAFPMLWAGLAVTVALIAGAFWTATMYKTYYSAVKSNIFKKIAHKLKYDWSGFSEKTPLQKMGMICLASLKYGVTAALTALGLIAVIASVGAYGSAILEVFSFIPPVAVFVIGVAILPVRALFAMKHAVGAVEHISKEIAKGFRWLINKSLGDHKAALINWFKNDFCKHPFKTFAIAVLGAIFFAATVLHVLAEAALDMGGNASNTFWQRLLDHMHVSYRVIDKMIHAVANLVKLSTQQLVVLIQSAIEFLEHVDFAFRQTPKMINAFVALPERGHANVTQIDKRVQEAELTDDLYPASEEANLVDEHQLTVPTFDEGTPLNGAHKLA